MKMDELNHSNGTYVCLLPSSDSIVDLQSLQTSLNLSHPVNPNDLHMTVIYSRVPCPAASSLMDNFTPISGYIKKLGYLPSTTGNTCLVAEIMCSDAHNIHRYIREQYGASHDYPDYIAHITLSYDCKMGIRELLHPIFITFDQLRVSPLDTSWQSID